MSDAARAFLTGLVDYAGLFPPANLDMGAALAAFASHRRSREGWMLGRFLCPITRLVELAENLRPGDLPEDSRRRGAAENRPPGDRATDAPLPLALIARPFPGTEEFLTSLEGDVRALREFLQAHRAEAELHALETKAPAEIVSSREPEATAAFLNDVAQILGDAGWASIPAFVEMGFPGEWRELVAAFVAGIRRFNATAGHAGRPPWGLKIRCGGESARDVPGVSKLAFTVAACRDAGVPFKATAGLHHPFRHDDGRLGAKGHGFVNLFGAAVLAFAHDLGEEALTAILEDESAEDFRFDGGFAWRDLRATVEQVAEARERFATSFGSCSFEEPRGDLEQLGLLA